LRIVLADAVYRSDPEQGGGALLEAMPASTELFVRLRSVTRELALPVPAVSSLLDLAVDGSAEALARLLAVAPVARGAQRDPELENLLADGLVEVGDASPDELLAALRVAPAAQAQAAIELVAAGLSRSDVDPAKYPLADSLRTALAQTGAPAATLDGWLAVVERRPQASGDAAHAAPPAGSGAPAAAGVGPAAPGAAPALAPASAPAASPAVPSASRSNPAVLVTPATDARPATAVCTGNAPTCPGGG
jgi:hypothetical protein